ncbi:MAG TPA: phosphatase PAP2 family protein [Lacibacter sp.]|nr:phosphatase PAP2 family protein [Lacibacter sp.]HMO90315.1 phosphatase PAP2 family protein [Lacibacter sp.]HMP88418.1 phosphatase PAP2 family protein [Lacibacter sp.]
MNWNYNHPRHNAFTWAMGILVLAGGFSLWYWSKEQLFWKLNLMHSYPGDLVFRYLTHAGDGVFMLVVGALALGLGRRKLGVLLILSFLLSGLLAQGLKRLRPEPRPGRYFTQIEQIHKVEERLLQGNNSFPSGHTTTAFALFSLLAFSTRKYGWQLLFFMAAVFVGYSRIYLGQHFFKDVYAGALLGFACSLLLFWLFRKQEWDA